MQKMNRFLYLSAFMRNIQAHPAASRQARWKPDKAPVPFPCTLLQTPHAPCGDGNPRFVRNTALILILALKAYKGHVLYTAGHRKPARYHNTLSKLIRIVYKGKKFDNLAIVLLVILHGIHIPNGIICI